MLRSMGTWSILRSSLGAWESLVAEIDGHMEYIAEVAWCVGKACNVAAAYDLKTNWSVVARSA
ncbi:hypothetical protein NST28_25135 [Paenibacillus sp. FSL R10-2791]|uniref:hypothetical protein n=1 Tax=Paenibacillus sp. FSL R10-2791 TaxID=2954695 RepID=UPI0030F55C4D